MNFTLIPSLEHMTLVKIAVALWNQKEIRSLIASFRYWKNKLALKMRRWQEIENKVTEIGQQMSLPDHLKEKILCFVKPIGLDILKWKECHDDPDQYSKRDLKNALYWTPEGTVDKMKTAKAFINHEILDIKIRYRLACIYCLENDILKLWNEVPESDRNCAVLKPGRKVWQDELIAVWTSYLESSVNKVFLGSWNYNDIPIQEVFHSAAIGGNISAVEYFWQKLTPEMREKSLEKFTKHVANENLSFSSPCHTEDYADVLCFLLSQMSEKQLKSCAYKVLSCLLDWPLQRFFMETASRRMWDSLSAIEYFYVLNRMVFKRASGLKDCNYQKLFWEFWTQSPDTHKSYILHYCTNNYLMPKLLEIQDKESIELILNDANLKEKENIIFSKYCMIPCGRLMHEEKWDLLKFYIQECISSEDEMIRFKKQFRDLIEQRDYRLKYKCECRNSIKTDIQNIFLQFMDNLIYESNKKRSIEEGGDSSAKKLHMESKGSNA